MEIRPVAPAEYEEAGEVTAGAYMEFARPGDPGWEEYLAELADVAGRADRTEVYVAVEDGAVLGCVTLELDQTVGDDDEELPPDVSCIRMLGVRPEARGKGIGRALVVRCIDRSREKGRRIVTLRTTHLMKVAQRLYRDMGFERDPARDYVMDSGVTLLAFRLPLDPA
ncbi:MAG TPA: GNAT family N-acetyltransferase [Actinomycetota bacterium]